jgi:hypothetical protein
MKRMKQLLVLSPLLIFTFAASAGAVHLQDVYDHAGPGEGYDKLLVLDPGEVYTGWLVIGTDMKCAIHGNGALINLDFGYYIKAYQAQLDIDGCIITGGAYGLNYEYCLEYDSTVRNCTIIGNNIGIQTNVSPVTIKNCIVIDNLQYGIAHLGGPEPQIMYNCVWDNGDLGYAKFCFS